MATACSFRENRIMDRLLWYSDNGIYTYVIRENAYIQTKVDHSANR